MSVGGKRYPAANIGAADRLRDAAGQEAAAAHGIGARGALRALSVRAGIIVTGTEVLSGLIRGRQRAVAVRAVARARRRAVAHRGRRRPAGGPALGAGLPGRRRRRPDRHQRRARADRRRPDRRRRGGRGRGRRWATTRRWRSGSGRSSTRLRARIGGRGARCGRVRASRRTCPSARPCWSRSGTAPGLLVSAVRPAGGGAARAAARAADDVGGRGRDVAAAGAAGVGRDAGAADPALLRAARAADRGDAARADADALPLEITTCLRRGELEVATVFAPTRRTPTRRSRRRCASATATSLFSDDGATIDEVVARLLAGRTVATAESCTGGLMAGRLTDLAGSSAYVLGGLVVYSNEAKTALAGVPGRADRGARRGLARGGDRAGGGRALAPRRRLRDRHHRDRRARAAARRRSRSAPSASAVGSAPTARSAWSACPAAAPTCATARPRSRSTCSAPAAAGMTALHRLGVALRRLRDYARRARPICPALRPCIAGPTAPRRARLPTAPPVARRGRARVWRPTPRRCTSRSPSSARARPTTWRRSRRSSPRPAAGAAPRARRRRCCSRRGARAS